MKKRTGYIRLTAILMSIFLGASTLVSCGISQKDTDEKKEDKIETLEETQPEEEKVLEEKPKVEPDTGNLELPTDEDGIVEGRWPDEDEDQIVPGCEPILDPEDAPQ